MHTLGIIVLATGAAILYGIAHDQVTVRVSLEYFTVGHPQIFVAPSPTLLALTWGVIATWWVGFPLGVLLAVAARAGKRPKRSAHALLRPIGILIISAAGCALLAGLLGGALADQGVVTLTNPFAHQVPPDRHVPFLAAMWAHSASYAAGIVGAIVLSLWVWIDRSRLATPAG